jgi:hypothetical protein
MERLDQGHFHSSCDMSRPGIDPEPRWEANTVAKSHSSSFLISTYKSATSGECSQQFFYNNKDPEPFSRIPINYGSTGSGSTTLLQNIEFFELTHPAGKKIELQNLNIFDTMTVPLSLKRRALAQIKMFS